MEPSSPRSPTDLVIDGVQTEATTPQGTPQVGETSDNSALSEDTSREVSWTREDGVSDEDLDDGLESGGRTLPQFGEIHTYTCGYARNM